MLSCTSKEGSRGEATAIVFALIEWRGYTSHSVCQPSAARVLGAESGQSSPAEFYSRCIHVREQHSNQVNRWFKNSKVMLVRTI